MTEGRPEYRTLVQGQKHFSCAPLSAVLSTKDCAARFRTAGLGDSCRGCEVGRQHAEDHPAMPMPRIRQAPGEEDRRVRRPEASTWCRRCDRTGLRIIKSQQICVSCANRGYEHERGRNAKGRRPINVPPHTVEIGVERAGKIEILAVEAMHAAEALARVVGELGGARFIDAPRPGPAVFNKATRQFEFQCRHCGTVGRVLERLVDGRLERFAWCCAGRDPPGAGWRIAKVRQPVQGMHAAVLSRFMDADPGLASEIAASKSTRRWVTLPHHCAECCRGQLHGLLREPGGKWRVRCGACSADSSDG